MCLAFALGACSSGADAPPAHGGTGGGTSDDASPDVVSNDAAADGPSLAEVCTGCSPEQFCESQEKNCTGCKALCSLNATSCPPDAPKVCACDGNVYASVCEANAKGLDINNQGCKVADTPYGTFACGPYFCDPHFTQCEVTRNPVPICSSPRDNYQCTPCNGTCPACKSTGNACTQYSCVQGNGVLGSMIDHIC